MARRNLKVVKLRKPKVPDDSLFIETLVNVLDQARQGKVIGYAMVYIVESETGTRTIEAAKSLREMEDRLIVLGGIERMKANFMAREWPDE